jgi:hypothetical protein
MSIVHGVSRRTFLQTTFLTSLVMVMSNKQLFASVTPLQTLAVVQEDLFPKEFVTKSNALAYMSVVLKHSRISAENKRFIRNGTKWLHEESVKLFDRVYTELDSTQRDKVLKSIVKESWGKSWVKMVLSYILEASLGDPIYGINKGEFGWKWLGHSSGVPRPKEAYL